MKRKVFALTIAFALIFTASCSQMKQQGKKQALGGVESSMFEIGDINDIKITADNANIKSGCSNNSPDLQSCNKNSKLKVISQVSDWYAVNAPKNRIGFIHKSQCKPIVDDNSAPKPSASAPGSAAQGATAPKTPTTEANSGTLTSMEKQMINLINQARAQNNVPPLKIDMKLTNVARVKAQDMITNNYFSHYSPKYGSPFDMMKAFGINFVQAGENIAGNQNVQNAHNALMNSPGHRKNILNPEFTHIGIGIKKGGPYGDMFSQMFISKPQ